MKLSRALVVTLSATLIAACSSDVQRDSVGSSASALVLPGLVPIPIDPATGARAWQGTGAQLMLADAFAGCMWDADGNAMLQSEMIMRWDQYAKRVLQLMQMADCHYTQGSTSVDYALKSLNPVYNWFLQRNDPLCNQDTSTNQSRAVGIKKALNPLSIPPVAGLTTTVSPSRQNAEIALRAPAVQLCVAQRLRAASPGAAGAEALLLSGADQRELLEVTKERAQLSMLQYAHLGLAFATPQLAFGQAVNAIALDAQNYVPVLQYFAQTQQSIRVGPNEMGDDFATAVQMHTQVSQELAQLLVRSSSARLARGAPRDLAPDTWGPGAWRQRALATLYGGAPLVSDPDGASPWSYFDNSHRPSQFGGLYGDWPQPTDTPWVNGGARDPLVGELLGFARRFDAIYLKQDNGPVVIERIGPANRSIHSHPTDISASAQRLYRAVEAGFRTDQCVQYDSATSTCKQFQSTDSGIADYTTAPDGYSSYLLWQQYHIAPSVAEALVRQLDQYVDRDASLFDEDGNISLGPYARLGAFDVDGDLTTESIAGAPWTHVGRNAQFVSRQIEEVAGLYSRLQAFSVPDVIYAAARADTQGFGSLNYASVAQTLEGARLLGSASALAAVREYITRSDATSGTAGPNVGLFFKRRQRILDLIAGAAGPYSVSVDPVTKLDTAGALVIQSGADGVLGWEIVVTTPAEDSFWSDATAAYAVNLINDDPDSVALALHPTISHYGRTLATALVRAQSSGPPINTTSVQGVARPLNRYVFRLNAGETIRGAFIATKKSGTVTQYKLLAGAASLVTIRLEGTPTLYKFGQYLPLGGALPALASRLIKLDPTDPTQPAFDAFGLPSRWTPPSNPRLFGGQAGTDAVVHYLDQARTAAQEATSAVQDAFTNLLKAQADEAELAATTAKAANISRLEQRSLCGDANPKCDTTIVDYIFPVANVWNAHRQNSPVPAGIPSRDYGAATYVCFQFPPDLKNMANPAGSLIGQYDDCLLLKYMTVIPTKFRLAKAVVSHENDPSVPSFQEYEGGTMQGVLINEWLSLRKLKDTVDQLMSAGDAAAAQAQAWQQKVLINQRNWDNVKNSRCSPDALAAMTVTTSCGYEFLGSGDFLTDLTNPVTYKCHAQTNKSPNVPDSALTWDDEGPGPSVSNSESFGVSAGLFVSASVGSSGSVSSNPTGVPIAARRRLCEQLKDSLDVTLKDSLAGTLEAYSTLADRASAFVSASAAVEIANASGASMRQQTELAKARAQLDVDMLAQTQVTSFGLYREIHNFDLWRAKALLENARVASVVARRAIESRFLVDLSTMYRPEPLVASPATWANEVYQYDLDMPSAVGITVGLATTPGIYPNRVLDYVENLQRFVNGYAIARPSAVADGDVDVLTLPGPSATNRVAGLNVDSYAWSFLCPTANGAAWRELTASGLASDACAADRSTPTRARIVFSLDPWGRMYGNIADGGFSKRYNERWVRFAVNIVGTGVLDCTKARDPAGCYSQAFILYDMTHVGPAWVTDFDQTIRFLGVPLGQVQGAKALAAEVWVDPLAHAFTTPDVLAVTRTEFLDRPLGGSYAIELTTPPQVVLERIQRIQVLVGSSYWVKQQ